MLEERIADVLRELLERGFELPFTMTAVSLNGTVIVVRYSQVGDALRSDVLAEHAEEPGFVMPANLLIADGAGEAARVQLLPDRLIYS